jgi:hypothetical protein
MKSNESFDPFDYPTLCLYAACIELGLRWLHDRARPPHYSRLRILPGRAASGYAMLAAYAFGMFFITACGPAFQSDPFEGEQDATVVLEESGKNVVGTDAAESQRDSSAGDAAPISDAAASDAQDSGVHDATVEACSCAVLCSGAYNLRACESCYLETCPTWEGGLPQ